MNALVWLRQDLRLEDNPALGAAVEQGGGVAPVFIWSPEEENPWPPGGASRWWLHHSLAALDAALRAAGSRLIIRRGPALETLRALARETGASSVFWNRRYEPAVTARDARVKEALRAEGLLVKSFNAALLHEPWTIQNKSGRPFQVFTPFWKQCLTQPDPGPPRPAPRALPPPRGGSWPAPLALKALELLPTINWTAGLHAAWQPGEAGAQARLAAFLAHGADAYAAQRDALGDEQGTSRLSPHLHFGEISPRQIWHACLAQARSRGKPEALWRQSKFLAELGWREFAHHLLYHFPRTPAEPLRPEFHRFPWREDAAGLKAWREGRTGFPLVDAGMRELWATGWMHNRARMAAASFLVKDLLLPWQEGAFWFWDTLVDADLAQNTLGWQWAAGCGADAAPFFRIFNPTSQGEKFDAQGHYVRRWCPELAWLPDAWIHRPEQAPAEVLSAAGVTLGQTYPAPMCSHAEARKAALAAFAAIKAASEG